MEVMAWRNGRMVGVHRIWVSDAKAKRDPVAHDPDLEIRAVAAPDAKAFLKAGGSGHEPISNVRANFRPTSLGPIRGLLGGKPEADSHHESQDQVQAASRCLLLALSPRTAEEAC